MSDWNTIDKVALDNYITDHYGEDSVRGERMDDLQRLYEVQDAARALLIYIDKHPHRLTAGTFGSEAEQAKRLLENLRDALARILS